MWFSQSTVHTRTVKYVADSFYLFSEQVGTLATSKGGQKRLNYHYDLTEPETPDILQLTDQSSF